MRLVALGYSTILSRPSASYVNVTAACVSSAVDAADACGSGSESQPAITTAAHRCRASLRQPPVRFSGPRAERIWIGGPSSSPSPSQLVLEVLDCMAALGHRVQTARG